VEYGKLYLIFVGTILVKVQAVHNCTSLFVRRRTILLDRSHHPVCRCKR